MEDIADRQIKYIKIKMTYDTLETALDLSEKNTFQPFQPATMTSVVPSFGPFDQAAPII